MSVFSRLGTLLKSNINDLISRAENPEKILNQLILDMREQLLEAKKQVATAIADEKKLRKQLDNELHLAREWEKKAMMAVHGMGPGRYKRFGKQLLDAIKAYGG